VFAGFSASSLKDRIDDSQCKLVITSDQSKRAGKALDLKKIVDQALADGGKSVQVRITALF
jgi:acetyl-CoA synthetase